MMPTNCSVLRTLTILPNIRLSWDYHHIFPQGKYLPLFPLTLPAMPPAACSGFLLLLLPENTRSWCKNSLGTAHEDRSQHPGIRIRPTGLKNIQYQPGCRRGREHFHNKERYQLCRKSHRLCGRSDQMPQQVKKPEVLRIPTAIINPTSVGRISTTMRRPSLAPFKKSHRPSPPRLSHNPRSRKSPWES